MTDGDAYLKFPKLRHFYNKLWLSEHLGYYCGPAGIGPPESNHYIVRPIMNLSGMGVGSSRMWIDAGDTTKVPPGYFWCELFEGRHLSITYQLADDMTYEPKHSYEGFKDSSGTFLEWKLTSDTIELPRWVQKQIAQGNVSVCNAEFIGPRLIEVHLRDTPDPLVDSMFPVWKGDTIMVDKLSKLGYSYLNSYDDADGFLTTPRLGFMIKTKENDYE